MCPLAFRVVCVSLAGRSGFGAFRKAATTTAHIAIMARGLLRVLAPSAMLLLTTTTIATLLQPAGGASSSGAELFEQCSTEYLACSTDETCAECSLLPETSSPAFDACIDDVTADGAASSTAACFGFQAGICCLEEASDKSCLQNDQFVEYWLCFLESAGCSDDELTCDDIADSGGSVVPSSNAAATLIHASTVGLASALLTHFLPLLWA